MVFVTQSPPNAQNPRKNKALLEIKQRELIRSKYSQKNQRVTLRLVTLASVNLSKNG